MWEDGGAEAGQRKKKIRGNEQNGVLIALDPKSASKLYCFWGCPKVRQSTRQHLHPQAALRPPTTRGNQSLNCVLFVCPLSHPVIAPARRPFLVGQAVGCRQYCTQGVSQWYSGPVLGPPQMISSHQPLAKLPSPRNSIPRKFILLGQQIEMYAQHVIVTSVMPGDLLEANGSNACEEE